MTCNTKYLKKPTKTTVMLHSADPKLTLNHVEWWFTILEEANIVFSVLVRDEASFKKITSKYPFLQILYAKSPVDVETVVNAQPNLKAVLYPTNRAKNIHLLRFIDLKHIFIGTKNSDWLSSFNKSYRAFDEMWISGNAQYDKVTNELNELRHLKLIKVGKPQIKNRFEKTESSSIAFLPFLENNKFSSFYKMAHNFKQDLEVKVIHEKVSDKMLKEYEVNVSKKNFKFIRDKNLFADEIISSQVIICDLSRLDVWLLSYDKPIFLHLPKGERFLHKDISEDIVTIFSDVSELGNLEEDTKTKEKREQFVEDVFGKSFTIKDEFLKNLRGATNVE